MISAFEFEFGSSFGFQFQFVIFTPRFQVDACTNYRATGSVRRTDALSSPSSFLLRFLFSLRLCFLRLPNGDYNALNESAKVVLDLERKMAEEGSSELRSRIAQIQKLCDVDSEFNPLELDTPYHCALHLENTLQHIVSDFPSFEIQDAHIHHLQEELHTVHLQSAQMADQIGSLTKISNDDSAVLEAKLEELDFSLHYIQSKDQKNTSEATEGIDSPILRDDCSNLAAENLDKNLELFELENKIDEMTLIVKSLQNLQFTVKWFEVVEQIEDAFTGLKVLSFDENCIKLSLQTYMPTFEGISYPLSVQEHIIDAAELNHELLIEVFEGTMKLKNVQVFPNDIYLSDIVDYTKSVSKSSLQWFIQKVQDRIILSTLRSLVIKDANKSRYSLEYLDKDETIVAHMAGGTDAYIKLSHGWPIFGSPLKLICIKGSDDLKRASLSFHCKVEKLANSLDTHVRQNISSFVDAVEKVLIEQLQLDLRVGDTSD